MRDHYRADTATVRRLRHDTGRILDTYASVAASQQVWPYQLRNQQPVQPGNPNSTATTAMLLHSIAVMTGTIERSQLVPSSHQWPPVPFPGALRDEYERRLDVLTAQLLAHRPDRVTESQTWGINDPLTLTWVWELAATRSDRDSRTLAGRVRRRCAAHIASLLEHPAGPLLSPQRTPQGDAFLAVSHVFPVLRTIQLALAITDRETDFAPEVERLRSSPELEQWLLEVIDGEIAASSIRDRTYDPAHLVFGLEALALLRRSAVDPALLERAGEVMMDSAQRAIPWRPTRPITVTPQGMILLPQSVEVANSFLRLSDLMDDGTTGCMFARSLGMFRRYFEWLHSSSIDGATREPDSIRFFGWQSEFTNVTGTVHLWCTSQVALFVRHYEAMLQQHIARSSREDAGLHYRPRLHGSTSLNPRRDPDADAVPMHERAAFRRNRWDGQCRQEPLLELRRGHVLRIYDQITSEFIAPRLQRIPDSRFRSFVLYGPPGTGKTSFAEAMADALNFGYLSISPSDFIDQGEAGVEARARRLFEVLGEQSQVIVLFDEVDRLLLDRNSRFYGRQSDMFQFMTPSMLTKFNDLHRQGRVIFVVATNYFERIDAAIKRPGRFDRQLLLLPPGQRQRQQIIQAEALRSSVPALAEPAPADALARRTSLFVFQELRQLVRAIADSSPADAAELSDATDRALRLHRPGITLASYKGRFFPPLSNGEGIDDSEPLTPDQALAGPWQEFSMLAYLCLPGGEPVPPWSAPVLSMAASRLDEPVRTRLQTAATALLA